MEVKITSEKDGFLALEAINPDTQQLEFFVADHVVPLFAGPYRVYKVEGALQMDYVGHETKRSVGR